MNKNQLVIFGMSLFLLCSLSACLGLGEDDGGPKEASCQKQFECGLLDDEEAMHDCSIGRQATLDRWEVVKNNDRSCEDLLDEYKDALKCIEELDCDEMAEEADNDGNTAISDCLKDYEDAVADARNDEDECIACWPEDPACYNIENDND